MAKIVSAAQRQADTEAQRVDLDELTPDLVFAAKLSKAPETENHRAQFSGSLDPFGTVRVRLYAPEDFDDTSIVVTGDDLRAAPKDIQKSKDGTYNTWAFEDTSRNILVLMWAPVAVDEVATVTINR